eukprot:142733_1
MNSGLFALLTIVALQFLVINVRYVSSANYEVSTISARDQNSKISVCEYCGKSPEKLQRCSGCKIVSYCNKKCQKYDWKLLHRELCDHIKSKSELLVEGYCHESTPMYMPAETTALINAYAKNDNILAFKIELTGTYVDPKTTKEDLSAFMKMNKLSKPMFVSEPSVPKQAISLKASVTLLKNGHSKIILGVTFKKPVPFNCRDPFKIEFGKSDGALSDSETRGRHLLSVGINVSSPANANTNKVYEYSKTPQYQESRSYKYVTGIAVEYEPQQLYTQAHSGWIAVLVIIFDNVDNLDKEQLCLVHDLC